MEENEMIDYEKKYNDLVNDLKELWNCHTNDSQLLGELAEICPELAESEDERMRKLTIALLSTARDKGLYELANSINKAIAWLEKQKEPENVSATTMAPSCWEVEQKEQKPVEIHIDNPNIQKLDPDVKVTTSDSSADGKELLYVSNKSYNIGFRDGVASVKPAERFEEAREKYQVEWSEEDEKQLDDIISIIRGAYEHGITISETRHRNAYLWLNNLRPSWKPSEEQMKALSKACHFKPYNCDILESLYDNLKKLI